MNSHKRQYIIGPLYERAVILLDKIEAKDTRGKSLRMLKEELGMVEEAIKFNEWLARFL